MFGAAPQSTLCFRCKESDSPHAVTVYMLEPHSCQYILGVSKKIILKNSTWGHILIFGIESGK